MRLPQVVIVGRPNVGKSSIFNWLAGRRLAVVDDTPGVTRDRVTFLLQEGEYFFEITDTGGMGHQDADNLTLEVEAQIDAAIDLADLIVFVVDTLAGLTPLDEEVARRLFAIGKPTLLVCNKTDTPKQDPDADLFRRVGLEPVIKVSVVHNRGRSELMEHILERLPVPTPGAAPVETDMKVAIVGKQNVGKSTFVNTLAQTRRMIVSEVPGTTRDSVDVRFELDGRAFIAIDTPGLQRHPPGNVEYYSMQRAYRSIRRADVTLLFFDSNEKVAKVEKQLCSYIAEQFKPCVFVVNKWDLMHEKIPTERWVTYLRETFPTMWHTPIAFITGQTGKNVKALLNHAQMLFKQSQQRVGTGELNRLVKAALDRNPPPLAGSRQPKIFYSTQVGVQPPTIVLVCNEPRDFANDYRRYLLGVFRDQLSFGEVPIKLYLKKRSQDDGRDDLRHGAASAG